MEPEELVPVMFYKFVVCYMLRCAGTTTVDRSLLKKSHLIQDWFMFGKVYISALLIIKYHEKFMHVCKGTGM